jgi:hypothetical protein
MGVVVLTTTAVLVTTNALATVDLLTPPPGTSTEYTVTQNNFNVFRLLADCNASVTGAISQMNNTNANNYTVEFRSDLSGNPGPVIGSLSQDNLGSATVTYSGAIDVVAGVTYWVGVRGSASLSLSNVIIRTGQQVSQWQWATGTNNMQRTTDGGTAWAPFNNITNFLDLTLRGTCTGGGGNGSGGLDASAASQVFSVTLMQSLPSGVTCSSQKVDGVSGSWVQLPDAQDCTTTSANGPALLGWATNPDFPVATAQRQVDNGWGAYETFNNDGQLTGVFIPAGGYTLLSNDTNLYPIWSS